MSTTAPCPSCGRPHDNPLEELWLARGALDHLGDLVARRSWRRLVLVADANTTEAIGDELAAGLRAGGHEVELVVFPERHGLLADEAAVGRVRAALESSSAHAAIAVGSGTLTDITRYATFLEKRPFCSVPTAASMDGYASSVAAMQFGGVKVSFPAHTPVAIFAEPGIVAAAPSEMAVWGLGDLLGKASASFDWRLGHGVTGEPFCAAIEARVLDPLRRCAEQVEGILAGDETPLQVLLGGLVESGVAMAMQGSSRPASGCEHHCSHFWDLLAFRGLLRHEPHGLQVGYATGFVTQLQASCLDGLALPLRLVPGSGDGDGANEAAWLGEKSSALGEGPSALGEKSSALGEGPSALAAVRDAKAADFAAYGPSWPPAGAPLGVLTAALDDAARLFAPVSAALQRAGIPDEPGFLGLDRIVLTATLRYANRLRNRFSVLDLLESQGRLDALIETLLAS